MTKKSRSKYILCTPWDEPTEIDIYNWKGGGLFINYWVRSFQEFERISPISGLIFYVVWNHMLVRDLPSYGDNVVAFIVTDEECVVPRYLPKVRFVFKTYGFQPWCGDSFPSPASALKCARDWAVWTRHYASFVWGNGSSLAHGASEVIPLGYAQQTDVPGKPFETRRYLVGFLGSIENKPYPRFSLKRLVGTPKLNARARMAESLRNLADSAPESVFFGTTASFTESVATGAGDRYSEIMADTKIALSPRGSSVETYRFFEAMRQGCIVICDRLPPHWFYAGCPAIQIDDWRNLEAVVKALSADPLRLARLHRETLAWWDAKLSEPALAGVIAKASGRRAVAKNRPREADFKRSTEKNHGGGLRARRAWNWGRVEYILRPRLATRRYVVAQLEAVKCRNIRALYTISERTRAIIFLIT